MRKQRENNTIENLGSRLKILRRVTLSCRFKSGPGHQAKSFQSLSGFSRKAILDKKRQNPTPSDAFMMCGVW